VVAADGVSSAIRSKYADAFRPSLDVRRCKYIWLGTDLVFDAFTFYVAETPYGVMQIHGYPYDAHGSTFIVEMHESVWRRAGFDAVSNRDFRPGESDHASIRRIRELFGGMLSGYRVLGNNSRWISFTTVRNEAWRHGNVVLLGDAAHTAHFSIGSGIQMLGARGFLDTNIVGQFFRDYRLFRIFEGATEAVTVYLGSSDPDGLFCVIA
jgi:anthraniloyl-CoA monooxygenase